MQEHISTMLFFLPLFFQVTHQKKKEKAFHNVFAPVLLDSAYSNTLSAEPKPFPQDDRNLLYNSASNSGTYCSCSSVSQTRIHFTETTTALKTDHSQRPNMGVCSQFASPLWCPPPPLFPLLILIPSFFQKHLSTCRRESLTCLLAAVCAAGHMLHNVQNAPDSQHSSLLVSSKA